MIDLRRGDALDLIGALEEQPYLVVTDPPYAFSGSGPEHALSATVAIVLREAAQRLERGGWMAVFCASSWRSTAYMVEAARGILRIATWCKPQARTKARTPGWLWATVNVVLMRKGKAQGDASELLDHITAEPVRNGRRAELPAAVADWAVSPFAARGKLMLDPFAGSGTLLEAASRCGMRAVGFEKAAEAAA